MKNFKKLSLTWILIFIFTLIGLRIGDGIFATKPVWAAQNYENEIYTFMKNEMKLNDAATAGVLANIFCESGFSTTITGDKGTSIGICQWHDSAIGVGRMTDLKNFCEKEGYDYTSIEGQLAFLKYELEGVYSYVYKYLKTVSNSEKGAYDAGYYWCMAFEIPTDVMNVSRMRASLAKDTYWPKYSKNVIQSVGQAKLTEVSLISNAVQLKWEKVTGASGYKIYRKKATSNVWELLENITSGLQITYKDVLPVGGVEYSYAVEAYTTLVLYQVKQESVSYYKSPSKDAKQMGSLEKDSLVQMVKGYSFQENGKTWVQIYKNKNFYYVDLKNLVEMEDSVEHTSVLAERSQEKKILFLKMPVCKIKNKKEGIQISWDVVSGAKGYVVYRRSVGGKYKKIKTLQGEKNCVYVDTKVSDGVTYLYTVRAFSDTYKSDFKSAESCKYIVEPVLSSVKQVTTGIELRWKKVSSASRYYIYRKTANTDYRLVGNISAKTGEVFIDQELENGKRYYYTVRAGFGTYLSSFQPSVGVTYSVKLLNRQTTSNVNYRLQPGLNGVKVGTIEKGTQIQVVKGFEKKVDGYTWVQILYNKKIYYLVAEYLK